MTIKKNAGVMTKGISVVLFCALAACGQGLKTSANSQPATGIIGGTQVDDADPISKMTALLVNAKEGSLCTVSIISDEWLLTAGHCVEGANASDLYVIFSGSFQDLVDHKTPASSIRKVASAVANPGYGQTMAKLELMEEADKKQGHDLTPQEIDGVQSWGDIALIHIAGKIPDFKVVAPFLPSTSVLHASDSVTLAGYGQTGTSESSSFGTLNKVDVNVVDPAWGTGTEVTIDNSQRGACHGDSGGPAYLSVGGQLYLFGVTSRGMGDSTNEQCKHTTVYTNATSYHEWIQTTIGSH